MSDKIKKIGYSLPGGSGSGDMTQAVYDPAGKAEQVLTISDLSEITNVVTTTESTLQDYIDNVWSSGDIAIGDVVIIDTSGTPEHYMLTANDGGTATDYSLITATSHSELSDIELAASGVTNGHIDDQAQTIAGAKTFSDKLSSNTTLTIPIEIDSTQNQAYIRLDTTGASNVLFGNYLGNTFFQSPAGKEIQFWTNNGANKSLTLADDGSAIFIPETDSTTAFQLKDASGNADFNYDSTNGRIGLGTINPQTALHLYSTSNTFARFESSLYSAGFTFVSGATTKGILIYDYINDCINLSHSESGIAGLSQVNIKEGNLGIGTATPANKLHIIGGSGAIRLETATADSTNKYGRILVGHYLNAEEPFLAFSGGSLNGNNIAFIGGTSSTYNTATQVRFYTASNYTTLTGTERMRLDGSGRLGIGTDTALSRLDVSDGGLGVTIGADSLSTTRTDTTNKNARIGFAHYTNAEEPFTGLVGISNSTDNILYVGGGSSIQNSATSIRFYTYATNAQTTGTERMRIDGDGDVGIGTPSPTSPSSFSRFLNIHGTTDASLELSGSSLTESWTVGATANGFQIRDDGTEKFTIDTSGDAWFIGDVSALSFTDRTPYPESTELAIEAVKSVQRIPKGYDKNNKEKQLDHDKLHPFLRGSGKNPGRDMSANISCNTEIIKYLLDVIDGLNKDIDLLYRQKGEVRPSQQHKPKNFFKRIFG